MRISIPILALVSCTAAAQPYQNWSGEYWPANECRSALIVFTLEHNGLNDCLLGLPRATLLQVFARFRRACERTPREMDSRVNDLRPLFMQYYRGICGEGDS